MRGGAVLGRAMKSPANCKFGTPRVTSSVSPEEWRVRLTTVADRQVGPAIDKAIDELVHIAAEEHQSARTPAAVQLEAQAKKRVADKIAGWIDRLEALAGDLNEG